jgi:hypothetical protein
VFSKEGRRGREETGRKNDKRKLRQFPTYSMKPALP